MSTFGGIINEFPSLSVDRFDGDNLKSTIFFLSHCHSDHTCGLENPEGIPGPLYVSPISAVIVKQQFVHIKQLVVLADNKSTPIEYTDSNGKPQYLTVTTLPAFHCPGSVMFLFEKDNLKVLYTGDFRVSKRVIEKVNAFRDSSGSVISIDKMYLDSTFLHREYLNFPEQMDSIAKICEVIEEWLALNSKHVISLKVPARYGYEWLLERIASKMKRKIHVNSSELSKYRYIPELDDIFTTKADKSQIHACFDYYNKDGKSLTCNPTLDPSLIRVIKPTAMIWKDWEIKTDFVIRERNEVFRVCYSNHSSFTEISDFVRYLKPKHVDLNVIPKDPLKREEMLGELAIIMGSVYAKNSSGVEKINDNHQSNWDNLNKISKINLKFSQRSEVQAIACYPPKRKKF